MRDTPAVATVRWPPHAASETVALLDEQGPVLDSDQDVSDLTMRLIGHVKELTPHAEKLTPMSAELQAAVTEARRLAEQHAPAGNLRGPDQLQELAAAVQQILDHLDGTPAAPLHWRPMPLPSPGPGRRHGSPEPSTASDSSPAGARHQSPHRAGR
ncbi:DUF6415 family natural product biosynthesis protein [Streptomyces sp. NBC_00838]|uniref:DUF6415 family natural product biosynthesis protein n=1 Tax=Streptomyces sp. NBC_00838 TaxID=2903680 RepID=UPI003868C206